MRPKQYVVWLLLAVGLVTAAQADADPPARRAVYVRDAATLLADAGARARLVRRIDAGDITDVVPYGLGAPLATAAGRTRVAAWIDELHRHGARVIVPIAGSDRLAALEALLVARPRTYLDGLVTELEFWNRADRADAFAEMRALVREMRTRARRWSRPRRPVSVGAYLGYPTAREARQLATSLDFVFLDYSVSRPARAWHHVHHRHGPLRTRYAAFAAAGVAVWPIFYATGEVDMLPALRDDGVAGVERRFLADQRRDRAHRAARPAGFVYFTFEALPEP